MVRVIPDLEDAVCLFRPDQVSTIRAAPRSATGVRSQSCFVYIVHGPIGQIIRRHLLDFHTFADDSQLYVSFKINDPTDENTALNPGMCERSKSMAES